jgi:hypothetical protein
MLADLRGIIHFKQPYYPDRKIVKTQLLIFCSKLPHRGTFEQMKQDITRNELLNNNVLNQELWNKEVLNKELVNKKLLTKELSNKKWFNKENQSNHH